jgi:ParB family transcriptional regulator, chromosome partitioning protein
MHNVSRLFSTSPLILGVIEDVEIGLLRPFKHNCRSNYHLDDISNSIRQKGLLQPILARNDGSHYEIIAGHRRYEACKKLGWRKIICHILELDDKEAYEISLIENVQRKTLNPIEEAEAYKRYVLNYGWGGISDLATRIGKSPSYIDKRLRLLDLPSHIVNSISDSTIKPSTAEEILSVKDGTKQAELGDLIKKHKLSSRGIRELIKFTHQDSDSDSVYDYNCPANAPKIRDIDTMTQRSFNKSIIALKTAMNKLSDIIEEVQENWILYEILMHHRNMIHNQIDVLIKEKKKI